MDAYPGILESYSSVTDVYGAMSEPSGALLAHPGASEVPAGALEAHPDPPGVCRHIYCYYGPPWLQPSLHASRVSLHSSRAILYRPG